jgi:ferredoxin
MKVKIDYDLCMGDGNCSKVCPEVFGYDDSALKGIVKLTEVPPAHEKAVRRAADECAPGAVVVEE